jgi:hypothetical protein
MIDRELEHRLRVIEPFIEKRAAQPRTSKIRIASIAR